MPTRPPPTGVGSDRRNNTKKYQASPATPPGARGPINAEDCLTKSPGLKSQPRRARRSFTRRMPEQMSCRETIEELVRSRLSREDGRRSGRPRRRDLAEPIPPARALRPATHPRIGGRRLCRHRRGRHRVRSRQGRPRPAGQHAAQLLVAPSRPAADFTRHVSRRC